jgi:pre-mRNA-processing factor 19
MFCAISGETPEEPVVSKKTGHVFEKRLILKYLQTHENKCPITGEPLNEDDLLPIKGSQSVKPRPITATSLPSLLSLFQNEWDSLMLETYNLKKELDSVKKELSHALYQHDAACRVIARLIKERDEARNALANLGGRVQISSPPATKVQADHMELEATPHQTEATQSQPTNLPAQVAAKLDSRSEELSQQRRKRPISEELATVDDIKDFSAVSSNSTHKTSSPGISCLDIHPNQNLVITGGMDSLVVIFNRGNKKVESTIEAHEGTVTSVLFHPNQEDLFISTSADKTAKVWKGGGKSYDTIFTYKGHGSEVVGASINAVSDYFLTGAKNGTWALHDIKEGKTYIQSKDDQQSAFASIRFHPDGLIFGVGTEQGPVKIFDVKTQKVAANFPGHTNKVVDLCFSENGYHLATGSADGVVKFWDLRKGNNIHTLNFSEEKFALTSLDYDHSGTYFAVAGSTIRIFAGKSFEPVTVLDKHGDVVTDVKWGQDAKFLASTSMDRTLKIWGKKETATKKRKT